MEVRDSMLLPAYRASVHKICVFEHSSMHVREYGNRIAQFFNYCVSGCGVIASGNKFSKQSALITCAMPLTCALSTKAQNISNYI